MCGITGIVRPDVGAPIDPRELDAMTDALAHRGPDGRGTIAARGVGLGNRRLAILDLSPAGAQPMTLPDASLAITFNGAISNHVELRAELAAEGVAFRSGTDTEVLLHLWRRDGEAALDRLRGMFAFALHDRAADTVWLVRDRFGIKPLYWTTGGDGTLRFASEIKALVLQGGTTVDEEGLLEYLSFGFRHGPATLFEGVRRLEPGRLLRLRPGEPPRERTWWAPRFEPDAERARDLRAALEEASAHALRADVPVGVALSGGLDSSIVTALAARAAPDRLLAFSGAFPDAGPAFDESRFAAATAAHVGVSIRMVTPGPEEVSDRLLDIVRAMDEPAGGPGVVPQFAVARAAASEVTVLIGGQGGDELFAGYARQLVDRVVAARTAGRESDVDPAALVGYEGLLERADGIADPVARYHRLVDRRAGLDAALAPEWAERLRTYDAAGRFAAAFPETEDGDPLSRTMRYETTALLPALLQVEDRAGMAHGLESRVPLLDARVVDAALALAPAQRLAAGRPKAALRDAAGDLLPPLVRDRTDKMGFPVPLVEWARGPLRPMLREALLGTRARERGLVSPAGVRRLIESASPWNRSLWALLNLELWHRVFVDGE